MGLMSSPGPSPVVLMGKVRDYLREQAEVKKMKDAPHMKVTLDFLGGCVFKYALQHVRMDPKNPASRDNKWKDIAWTSVISLQDNTDGQAWNGPVCESFWSVGWANLEEQERARAKKRSPEPSSRVQKTCLAG